LQYAARMTQETSVRPPSLTLRWASGFTLVETLIATSVLVTALAGLAQLFALSLRFTRDSAQSGAALVAAQDKLESLRALRFGYDDNGAALTDPRLQPSPPTSLSENLAPYVDWLDDAGNVVSETGASYARRWRITEMAVDDPAAIAIDVCVFRMPAIARGPAQAEACLVTARVRQP
jgi:type II secretory pathway pseudopilin PulG